MGPTSSVLSPSGVPLYEQVKRAVLAALSTGEWKQGEAIPPEKLLSERFGVSIGTLRKAIDELVMENILVRHQGRGTFVAIHSQNQHFFKFFRIVRQDGEKAYPTTELQSFRHMPASDEALEKLRLPRGSRVFEFVNALSLHGEKVIVDTICVSDVMFRGLTQQQLRERPSTLYSFYQQMFGINVIATDERVRVAVADAYHAGLLNVEPGAPLLELRRVAYSFHQTPVEWRVSKVNTRHYEYIGQEHLINS
ncbi:GntR family transcriptional regulator [Parapusillimonas granuli]|uniref:GntR family transcriptional regulator n=1 Tax=Parapusillimonas granuli TaxID=380911 RepID=A0A853G3J3_9BURK|nr:GntR family transcriptional regulator [Parapusillimonas granuli]MBB5216376.1 GntR family transcriptional regulator [Parapusillimonas granuli]MEB2399899.1 GntR family transcriptional regulator [Alcaligenaceae bacterium]NYT51443.1 GntR family transcriptional regulator [Parapusillimonas granuli]